MLDIVCVALPEEFANTLANGAALAQLAQVKGRFSTFLHSIEGRLIVCLFVVQW